ncbi:MAG: ATP-dependent metalloprotease FtsH, partial [Frankiales bacterium]|nr:ATP-dependent metalloprotease FtsH [Frankiales bacterium]
MNLKKYARGPFLYVTLGLLAVLALSGGLRGNGGYDTTDTSRVLTAISEGQVKSTDKDADTALLLDKEQQVRVTLENGDKLQAKFLIDQGREFATAFERADVRYDVKVNEQSLLVSLLVSFLPFLIILGLLFFFMNQMQGGGSRVMQFGKSKAKLVSKDTPKTTFADVAGA